MAAPAVIIDDISDTARWAAVYRARETERPDALFKDPLARKLAGERGEQIAASLQFTDRNTWSWVTRTVLYDRFIEDRIRTGTDMVINLAAGLDTRPYRMQLPSSLRWVEVDLPNILAYKEQMLAGHPPVCAVQRIAMDLSDVEARRGLFASLSARAKNALIVTEGFLIYISSEEVGGLARDLAGQQSFLHWIVDLASPGLLQMLQKKMGGRFTPDGPSMKFAPAEGPGFFEPHGWRPAYVRSLLKTAASLKRLSLFMHLVSLLPASDGAQGRRPWGGVCLLERP